MTLYAANPEALARLPRALAFRHDALPLNVSDGVLAVAVPDPDDADVVDEIRAASRLRVRAVAMPRAAIREKLHAAYGDQRANPHDEVGAGPAVRAVEGVFASAIAAHASDIHIEPSGTGGRVRIRVDGLLRELETIPPALFLPFVSRVKLLAAMDIADRRQPQDGRCGIPFEGREIDARVASVPTVDGEKLVIRLLDRHAATPALGSLGMTTEMLGRYRTVVHAPWGFVVVTGPTGSGKTTTLYASLAELDARTRNICSVEDPVEMRLDGVSQVQVNLRASLTFPVVLRAFMRQDPNVMMVGEMRDGETAAVAVSAALAGQLVFATLHASDAERTIDRFAELGVMRHSLAAALTGIVAQRLVRRLCERCRTRASIPSAFRAAFAAAGDSWYVANGCRACGGTGYLGRTGVYEVIVVDDAIRDAVASGATSVQVANVAALTGFRPMLEDAVAKVTAGVTSFDELSRTISWSGAR